MAKQKVHKIDYIAAPTLTLFHQDDTFHRGVKGPFGSGKSVACCMEIMRRAQEVPLNKNGKRRSRWAIVRNTYKELERTTMKTWFEWFPEEIFGVYKRNEKVHYVKFDDVELEVVFQALDKPDDVKRLLSMELTGAWINEAREVPKAVVDALGGRVTRFPKKADYEAGTKIWFGIIMDTNPPDTNHWWYKLDRQPETYIDPESELSAELQIENLRKTYKFFSQPSGRSPLAENIENLDPNYYTRMCVGKDPEWVKVYVDGQYGFITDGRPVYPEFVDAVHGVDFIAPIRDIPIVRGWDFGLTPSCVFLQMAPNGRIVVLEELVSESMGIERFTDVVLRVSGASYPGFRFIDYGDPAGSQRSQTDEKTCFQIMYAKNIMVEPGKKTISLRIESVKKYLNSMIDGKPAFLINRPHCQTLLQGFMGGYQYRRMQTTGFEKYTDQPDKNRFSHIHDALQYAMSGLIGDTLIDPSDGEDEYEAPSNHHTRYKRGKSRTGGY